MSIVQGGQAFYGQNIGVLLLDAQYPRLPGDVGNALTYPVPVQFDVVEGLTADRLIHHFDPSIGDLVQASISRLSQRGARAVVGGCGFFAAVHEQIRDRSPIPFLSSSLLQVPWLLGLYGSPIGVLTIDADALDDTYLSGCGWSRHDTHVVVQGIDPNSVFAAVYFENRREFDPAVMETNVVDAALVLRDRAPNIRALVLECTNMAPFAYAIQAKWPVPIYDIQGLAQWVALAVNRYPYRD